MLMVLRAVSAVRGVWAVLLATLGGMLVSGTMEAVQTTCPAGCRPTSTSAHQRPRLPGRRGARRARSRRLLDHSRLSSCARRWFAPHASQGLVLLALWPLAQIYPQGYLFGLASCCRSCRTGCRNWLDTDIDLVSYIRPDAVLTVEQYWLSETIITACGMTGAVLTLLCLLRRPAPRGLAGWC
jgi:hypothetical protein